MAEEVKNPGQNPEEEAAKTAQPKVNPEDQNLLDATRNIINNTVSMEEYNRVLERNKQLSHDWAEGINRQEPAEKDKDTIESLRKELYSEDRQELNNLESTKKILKLRKLVMDEGGIDPFLNSDPHASYSAEEEETAQRVADGLQEMVDQSDGDPIMFNSLMAQMIPPAPGKRKYN